ncbi:hypothetical protein Val02_65810 [Virgisporangium aliadipatigenens]|uniref:Uncharacterized protein n=1 Tax=Virgisporangium aliadipatigenens TaxID=741659 RepID=A0A8J3YTL8_9ACTN|nr:hypothetical protein [Virgisporangium aliadipatigenens]GIJ49695.1 hypothetical protein Val02_65810 [Virgisporangium aliadipatigenens]
MADRPDWETMVKQVVIAGDPGAISTLRLKWATVFTRLGTVAAEIRTTSKRLEPAFGGPAGEAYRKRLEQYAKDIDDYCEKNRPILQMLDKASTDLSNAKANMPIPMDMVDDFEASHKQVVDNNTKALNYAAGNAAISTGGLSLLWYVAPGSFKDWVASSWVGEWTAEVWGKVDKWLNDETDKAYEEYQKVENGYMQAGHDGGNPMPMNRQVGGDVPEYDPSGVKPGGKLGGAPGGLNGGGAPPDIPTPTTDRAIPDDFGPTNPGIDSDTAGFDPSAGSGDLPDTGLAGAGGGLGSGGLGGGGGLSPGLGAGGGLGAGSGGLGGGGLGGGGVGAGGRIPGGTKGLGAGGIGAMGGAGAGRGAAGAGRGGAGRGGIGKGVSPAGLLGSGAGAGARGGAGAGRGAAGAGRAAGRAGMMGGMAPAAGHGPGDEADHATWLVEDDDVWGSSDDLPPQLLG